MTDAINNNQSRMRSSTPALDNKSAAPQSATSSPNSTSQASSSSSVVDIKSTKLLETLSAQIDKLPDMDMSKIDSIKQSIANGEYQANAEVIAQKFTEIERLL